MQIPHRNFLQLLEINSMEPFHLTFLNGKNSPQCKSQNLLKIMQLRRHDDFTNYNSCDQKISRRYNQTTRYNKNILENVLELKM